LGRGRPKGGGLYVKNAAVDRKFKRKKPTVESFLTGGLKVRYRKKKSKAEKIPAREGLRG